MEITLVKTLSGTLKPAYDSDHEKLKKIPLNEEITFSWKKVRNPKFHRKFFKLVSIVFNNQETFNNQEHMRKSLTIKAGFYDMVFDLENGEERKEAQSIAFENMDDNDFSEFYSRFIDAVIDWLKWDKQELIDEIEQYF